MNLNLLQKNLYTLIIIFLSLFLLFDCLLDTLTFPFKLLFKYKKFKFIIDIFKSFNFLKYKFIFYLLIDDSCLIFFLKLLLLGMRQSFPVKEEILFSVFLIYACWLLSIELNSFC